MRTLIGFTLLVPSAAAQTQTFGPWVVSAPDAAALVVGGGSSWSSLNVVNIAIDENEAFSGLPMDDDGFANGPAGTTVEVTFTSGVVNGPGDDLLMLEAQFDVGTYTITCDFDGFVAGTTFDTLGATVVATQSYFYLGAGPYSADVVAVAVDLSSLGVPGGASVNGIRFTLVNFGCDPIGLGRIEHSPGSTICFGDGSGASCLCANESDPMTGGCRNSVSGTSGAGLSASGTAGQDQTTDPLTFACDNVRTQPGLLFCALNTIGGGTGQAFGDGIRCCGGGVVRVELINPPLGPEPVTVTTTVTFTPAPAGEKRCYQYWYRDPGGPCGTNFNLSNAVTVTWGP